MPDIWLPLVATTGSTRFAHAGRMSAPPPSISGARSSSSPATPSPPGAALDEAGIAATVAETGLPLIGPGIARLCRKARRRRPPLDARAMAAGTPRRGRWRREGPRRMLGRLSGSCHCGALEGRIRDRDDARAARLPMRLLPPARRPNGQRSRRRGDDGAGTGSRGYRFATRSPIHLLRPMRNLCRRGGRS